MTRLLGFLFCAIAFAQSGTSVSVPANTWTNITGSAGITNFRVQGWENLQYVDLGTPGPGSSVCAMEELSNISSEPNGTWVCFSWKYNRFYILSNISNWHDVYQGEGGHPLGSYLADASTSVGCGGGNYSGGQTSEKPNGRYCFDFRGLAGRNLQISTHQNYNNQLAAGAYDQTHGVQLTQPSTDEYVQSTGALATNVSCASFVSGCPPSNMVVSALAFNSTDGNTYLFGGTQSNAVTGATCTTGAVTLTVSGGTTGYVIGQYVTVNGVNPGGYNVGTVATGVTPGSLITGVTSNTISYSIASCPASYVSGGVTNTLINQVYSYNQPTHTWSARSPSGTPPDGRFKPLWVYDSVSNVFILFGGSDHLANAYGGPGENVLADTWVLDMNAGNCGGNTDGCWSQLSPATSPTGAVAAPNMRGAYDSVNDVVELWDLVGNVKLWAFRYLNTGPNAGNATAPTYSVAAGSYNASTSNWGERPSLASTGTTLYLGWMEQGSGSTYGAPYADAISSANVVTPLGGTATSMASEITPAQSGDISMSYINGAANACWHQGNNSAYYDRSNSKSWGGSSWAGGLPGVLGSGQHQGQCAMTAVGGTVYLAVKESQGNSPDNVNLYVTSWTGSAWTAAIGGAINSGATGNVTDSVSMYSDGTHPCIAWTEWTNTVLSDSTANSKNQTYAACYIASTWTKQCTTAANINTSNRDFAVFATYMAGQTYLAFTERPDSGNAQVFVTTCGGASWSQVGASYLNISGTGWAFRPEITNDGTNLYVTWDEQSAYGSTPQIYVKKWNGAAWTQLGSSLNVSAASSAQHPSIAILNGNPVVAWGELALGTMRQIYAKAWAGSTWGSIGAVVSGGGSLGNFTSSGGVIH